MPKTASWPNAPNHLLRSSCLRQRKSSVAEKVSHKMRNPTDEGVQDMSAVSLRVVTVSSIWKRLQWSIIEISLSESADALSGVVGGMAFATRN
jgi:hypothetical protein